MKQYRFNINHRNVNGETALMYLMHCHDPNSILELGKFLVDNGTDVNIKNNVSNVEVFCKSYTKFIYCSQRSL